MLLVELLKLFSNNFDINEERFISIIQTNNIKLSQRLLVEVSFEKKIITNVTNKINEAPINETNIITSNTNISNILNDSNINVLSDNYNYLFWSILASAGILITMTISK
jgi:hypothetical protein